MSDFQLGDVGPADDFEMDDTILAETHLQAVNYRLDMDIAGIRPGFCEDNGIDDADGCLIIGDGRFGFVLDSLLAAKEESTLILFIISS